MLLVADTHPLIWLLEDNARLSPAARQALGSQAPIVIPSICLAEVWHSYHRKRVMVSPDELQRRILSAPNVTVHPLDQVIISLLPVGLDIHDAVIVATAKFCRDVQGRQVKLVTHDRKIAASGLVDVLW